MLRQIFTQTRCKRMISFLIDVLVLVILLEAYCFIFGYRDLKATLDMLHALNGMGGNEQDFYEAYALFYTQFMRIYQQFLRILITYMSVTMMLLKGRTLGLLAIKMSLVSAKEEEYYRTYLRYIVNAVVTALTVYLFNSTPFLVSSFFIFADDKCLSGVERLCSLRLEEGPHA